MTDRELRAALRPPRLPTLPTEQELATAEQRLQLTARRDRQTLPARALRAVLRSVERGGKPEHMTHVRRDSMALAGAAESVRVETGTVVFAGERAGRRWSVAVLVGGVA